MDISRTMCSNQASKLYRFHHQNISRFSSYRFPFRKKEALHLSLWRAFELCAVDEKGWDQMWWWAIGKNGNDLLGLRWPNILFFCLKCFLAPIHPVRNEGRKTQNYKLAKKVCFSCFSLSIMKMIFKPVFAYFNGQQGAVDASGIHDFNISSWSW